MDRWYGLRSSDEIDDQRNDDNGSKNAAAEIHKHLRLFEEPLFDHMLNHASGRQRT